MDRQQVIKVAAARAKIIFDEEEWSWYGDEAPPTVEEIVETISYLIGTVQDPIGDNDQASTGRLTVQRSPYHPEDPEAFEVLLQIGDFPDDA